MNRNCFSRTASIVGLAIALIGFAGVGFYFSQGLAPVNQTSNSSTAGLPIFPAGSFEGAQQVFEHRCIECHSCNTAPCQLKLTSYEGVRRGLTQIQVYDPARTSEIAPTRLGIDAHGEVAWRARGFVPVVTSSSSAESTIFESALKNSNGPTPQAAVLDRHACPLNVADLRTAQAADPSMLMPYGLPALTAHERESIMSWVHAGAKPPLARPVQLSNGETAALKSWQAFLNQSDLKTRLVARYLFEHLFLAHLQLDAQSTQFYRLIRSRNLCGSQAVEIPTRRPTDDPGASLYYCLQPLQETIVEKTHLPYLLDSAKLARIKSIFFGEAWVASAWPGYANGSNPFVTYFNIPVKARYQFLLEDSKYHVATFIKGPVCNGNGAVNAIDEHFFVTFVDPKSELQILDPELARQSAQVLQLPAETSGGFSLVLSPNFLAKYIHYEKLYKDLKETSRNRLFPKGYKLTDIWAGEGKNPNALLTVFRHSENAEVLQGFQGGFANSIFVLDYPLFERLVYNLAVDFDVFGAVSHQLYTRTYMGLIRREAEDNLLNFIPPEERPALYGRWEGWLPSIQDKLMNFDPDTKFPTQIEYKKGTAMDQQFIQKLVTERYAPELLGRHDFINTRWLNLATLTQEDSSAETEALRGLKALSQVPAKQSPFVQYMSDSSIIIVQRNEKILQIYTMIRNKAHSTIGKLFREEKSRDPSEDNMVFVQGLATSYPNHFYVVSADSLPSFIGDIQTISSPQASTRFNDRWGVARENDSFWKISDSLHDFLKATDPVNYGYLDYSRYGL